MTKTQCALELEQLGTEYAEVINRLPSQKKEMNEALARYRQTERKVAELAVRLVKLTEEKHRLDTGKELTTE
jgi:hypothetical protein